MAQQLFDADHCSAFEEDVQIVCCKHLHALDTLQLSMTRHASLNAACGAEGQGPALMDISASASLDTVLPLKGGSGWLDDGSPACMCGLLRDWTTYA